MLELLLLSIGYLTSIVTGVARSVRWVSNPVFVNSETISNTICSPLILYSHVPSLLYLYLYLHLHLHLLFQFLLSVSVSVFPIPISILSPFPISVISFYSSIAIHSLLYLNNIIVLIIVMVIIVIQLMNYYINLMIVNEKVEEWE